MLRFFIKRSLFIFALFTHSTFAGDIGTQPHTNTLSIYRETSSSVVLNFEINVSLVMRKILAPQLSHEEFLKFFITLSDEKFQKSIQIVQKDLNEKRQKILSEDKGRTERQQKILEEYIDEKGDIWESNDLKNGKKTYTVNQKLSKEEYRRQLAEKFYSKTSE
jgi:hypothetical protein